MVARENAILRSLFDLSVDFFCDIDDVYSRSSHWQACVDTKIPDSDWSDFLPRFRTYYYSSTSSHFQSSVLALPSDNTLLINVQN